jgi:hypothetical protein
MQTKFVQNPTLFKKDYFAPILLKMEKKSVNIFQPKENGVTHPEVLEPDN